MLCDTCGKYHDTILDDINVSKVTVYCEVLWDVNTVQFESLYCWQRLHTETMKSSQSEANFFLQISSVCTSVFCRNGTDKKSRGDS